jgi:DNA-binding NarL/FixJ family response regulator
MNDAPAPIRILIADDRTLTRMALRFILEAQPDLTVVAEAGDGLDAIARARECKPDVVLMDINMPRLDGIEATRRIAAILPQVRVLVLSTFDLDANVVSALQAGASGFLPMDVSPEELTESVRVVHRGEAAVAPRLLARLIQTHVRQARPFRRTPPNLRRLTAREREVLTLIAQGLSNAGIAASLGVSASTVKNHITSLFRQLEIRDRAQAVIIAYEARLVTPGELGLGTDS